MEEAYSIFNFTFTGKKNSAPSGPKFNSVGESIRNGRELTNWYIFYELLSRMKHQDSSNKNIPIKRAQSWQCIPLQLSSKNCREKKLRFHARYQNMMINCVYSV